MWFWLSREREDSGCNPIQLVSHQQEIPPVPVEIIGSESRSRLNSKRESSANDCTRPTKASQAKKGSLPCDVFCCSQPPFPSLFAVMQALRVWRYQAMLNENTLKLGEDANIEAISDAVLPQRSRDSVSRNPL